MSRWSETDRLARVELREAVAVNRPPAIQQELDVALFDLGEVNRFRLQADGMAPGPYALRIGMAERLLVMEISADSDPEGVELHLSLSPLRGVIKDYFEVCEIYLDAVKRLPPDRIEAIDVGRRGIHDEGARILAERLSGRIDADHDTFRRLFTVICALQVR